MPPIDVTVCGHTAHLSNHHLLMRHIGDDISQKLDYVPDVLTVENHVRPKYVCDTCKTLNQAPVPAHVIDKGLPTAGLLASVLIMKYVDHLLLYRQETIFERSGWRIPRYSARLNGHDPSAYLKDVLERLPTHKAKDIADLLPHRWQPTTTKEVTL